MSENAEKSKESETMTIKEAAVLFCRCPGQIYNTGPEKWGGKKVRGRWIFSRKKVRAMVGLE